MGAVHGAVAALFAAVVTSPPALEAAAALADLAAGTTPLGEVPPLIVLLFGLVTQLGDPWFLFLVVAGVHLLATDRHTAAPRRTGAILIAAMIGAAMLTLALKVSFGVSRPAGADVASPPAWFPELIVPLFQSTTTASGFSFPSGHAVGATVVYGSLVYFLDAGTRRARRLAAAALVGLVALSRVVIGVHRLVDVAVGILVGLAFLAVLATIADRPAPALGLAVGIAASAVGAAVASGHAAEVWQAVAGLGAAVGAFGAWRWIGGPSPAVGLPAAAATLALSGGAWAVAYVAVPPLPATFLVNAAAIGAVVAAPRAVVRIRRTDAAERLRNAVR